MIEILASGEPLIIPGQWPWWLGSLGLASVALGFCWLIRRPLGVSGFVRRVVFWSEQRQLEREREELEAKQQQMQQALAAAAAAELAKLPAEQRALVEAQMAKETAPKTCQRGRPWTVSTSFLYLVGICFGGLLAQLWRGQLSLEWWPKGALVEVYSESWVLIPLFIGGLFVGFGTSMAGGCTSGHGLSGTARFQMGSWIATATFFGTAIATSFLLKTLFLGN